MKKKKLVGVGLGGGGQGGCERRIEGVGWWVGLVGGVRVDVNAMLG